ncbi:hypothetical protein BDA99DRAFT_506099 [Phascolomyces articulosus]|uniref:Squamous cell carcinoma antigen recognized by T-cells 3 n=1 Tax=Phascolomyces articulosus TaxID=60185 RepID=A0AAD5PFH3_9FUNG|nr:hypothetical protein BDA99DRAFT_506099 [Phascolomyces articulosus]
MDSETTQSPTEEQQQQSPLPQNESEMTVDQDNTEPGAWEVTKGSRSPKTKTPAVELSEEQQNEQTLEALDELTKIMEELAQDETRYDLHVRLIELLQQMNMEDELEQARKKMHDIYPLTEAMWLAWLEDAKKKADTENGDDYVRGLFEDAFGDYFSIAIWESFVDYILNKFNNQWDNDVAVQQTRDDLLRACKATEHHISKSQIIWNKLIDFETHDFKKNDEDENMEKDIDPEQLERIKQLYRDRLDTLHTSCEQTFNDYSTFNTKHDNENYEANMIKGNKLYSKVKAAVDARDQFELKLEQSNNALETFYEYIGSERTINDRFSLNLTCNLYERAITIYCTDVQLWDNYISFLLEHARFPILLVSVSRRSIRNCPWSGTLWAHYARSLEANNSDKEVIIAVFDAALQDKNLMSSLEDMVTLFRAKCDYLRRDIDWSEPSEDDEVDLRLAFEEALVYLDEQFPKTPDPYFRIERYYAFVESNLLDNETKAREIWENRVIRKLGRHTDAWLAYIEFERSCGNINKCQSLYKRAIQKNVDDPQRLTNAWLTLEHEIGSLDTLQDALVKVKQKENVLVHQWQEQIAYMEIKKEKDEEKMIKQKKAKAQHRLQSKARQKERRAQQYQASKQEEVVQKDSDGFKIPVSPRKRRASSTSDEGAPTPTIVKKTKTDHDDTEAAQQKETIETKGQSSSSTSGDRSNSNRGGRGRGRGRGRGKFGLGFNPRKSRTTEQEQPTQPTETAPKTQDDFRAMLLKKK